MLLRMALSLYKKQACFPENGLFKRFFKQDPLLKRASPFDIAAIAPASLRQRHPHALRLREVFNGDVPMLAAKA